MKISTTAGYGLIAAGCIAQHADEGTVLSTTISKEHGIPLEYLLKILQAMVRANVLRSKRGPRGGFTLARPANEITLIEIIEAAGGPIASQLELVQQTKKAPFSIEMEKVIKEATDKAEAILSKATLARMIGK